MNTNNGTSPLPYEANMKLAGMILQEMEFMSFTKERYDLSFPDHAKELSRLQMWSMARRKVVEELCVPDCIAEEYLHLHRATSF
ncbi:MAG: hypothetical protein HY913_18790 [Desulfomonile tiedjei]|nr:hypothetical protein [Desulfomonile tiedjei]